MVFSNVERPRGLVQGKIQRTCGIEKRSIDGMVCLANALLYTPEEFEIDFSPTLDSLNRTTGAANRKRARLESEAKVGGDMYPASQSAKVVSRGSKAETESRPPVKSTQDGFAVVAITNYEMSVVLT